MYLIEQNKSGRKLPAVLGDSCGLHCCKTLAAKSAKSPVPVPISKILSPANYLNSLNLSLFKVSISFGCSISMGQMHLSASLLACWMRDNESCLTWTNDLLEG